MSPSSRPDIAWAPRSILAGRTFRLPVSDPGDPEPILEAPGFTELSSRRAPSFIPGDAPGIWRAVEARFHYLKAPEKPGTYTVRLRGAERSITVLGFPDLLKPFTTNGVALPRRWRPGSEWESTKTARTLERDEVHPWGSSDAARRFWLGASDAELWRQLPPAEIPKAHFVNEHHGCPNCGTRVFRHGGFYPWKREHLPCTFLSECPSCHASFPSNLLQQGDFVSGEHPDDGYGYFDPEGRLYLFAATYHRDQLRAFSAGITLLHAELRRSWNDETARKMGLMLARYALEELYVAAAPQFRYGPSKGLEEPWAWGQEDWLGAADPVDSLAGKGTLHYSIDTPHVSAGLARAYDALWPFITRDRELLDRVRAQGLPIDGPAELAGVVEQMLACQLQCILDFGARSNLPEESLAALVILTALDRPDAHDVMEWLYERGPDRLGVFSVNDFLSDGSPPEATGGYNSIHTNGLFELERNLSRLRERHPRAYPSSTFPSVLHPARAVRCILQPHELTVIGTSWFQYGDGSAPGTAAALQEPEERKSILLTEPVFAEPLRERTYATAAELLDDPTVKEVARSVADRTHRDIGTTIHDRVGIAILRTGGAPERAALGIVYGDTSGHRHQDLGDVQLFAFGRPFLTDLGYPQSWATIGRWEGHWATHNLAWGIVPELTDRVTGRGRIVSLLRADGLQILDLAMERFTRSPTGWRKAGVSFRRLIALLETEGEGVAVIDLSRVRGGAEHWRLCRGLEGELRGLDRPASLPAGDQGPDGRRRTLLAILRSRGAAAYDAPDYEAFDYLDDAFAVSAPTSGRLEWRSRVEPAAALDLHLLGVTPGTELFSARSTQTMGTPEESLYSYRSLAWRRTPAGPEDVSSVDLVLEPRLGEPTLAAVRDLGAPASASAAAVEIVTKSGGSLRLYWSPWSRPDDVTTFGDGTKLHGTILALRGKRSVRQPREVQGTIVRVDREANAVELRAPLPIRPGGRARVLRPGCFASYAVTDVSRQGELQRLTLDVSSLLALSRVEKREEGGVLLADPLFTRSGYLTGARLQRHGGAGAAVVTDAAPADRQRTHLLLEGAAPEAGARVELVDYVAGDTLAVEEGPAAVDVGS